MNEVSGAILLKSTFRKKRKPNTPHHRLDAPAKEVQEVRRKLAEFTDKELMNLIREIDLSSTSGVTSPGLHVLLALLRKPEAVEAD